MTRPRECAVSKQRRRSRINVRVEKRALERLMTTARTGGDEAEFLRLQSMVKRVESALRSSA